MSGEVEPSKTETQWIGDEEEEEEGKDEEDNEKQVQLVRGCVQG